MLLLTLEFHKAERSGLGLRLSRSYESCLSLLALRGGCLEGAAFKELPCSRGSLGRSAGSGPLAVVEEMDLEDIVPEEVFLDLGSCGCSMALCTEPGTLKVFG